MSWVYSVEPISDFNSETRKYQPHGLQIVKSFYNDQSEIVITTETTAADASENSATDILPEYLLEVKESFKNQIDLMFDLAASGELTQPSIGALLGTRIAAALGDVLILSKKSSNE